MPNLERDMEGMENIWVEVSDTRGRFYRFITLFFQKRRQFHNRKDDELRRIN